jgi:hypothetical protein
MKSSQRIDFENPKDRFRFFSIVCASRVIALARSSIQLCCKGYALEAEVLARSLLEVSVAYEYLANNPAEADLFHEGKISTTDVVKQAIRHNKKLTTEFSKNNVRPQGAKTRSESGLSRTLIIENSIVLQRKVSSLA